LHHRQLYVETQSEDWPTLTQAQLAMTVVNPWQWYCSTRTFSNSLETTLTIMALYHWPWSILGGSKEKAEKMFRGGASAQRSADFQPTKHAS
jgi:hypothetical protein